MMLSASSSRLLVTPKGAIRHSVHPPIIRSYSAQQHISLMRATNSDKELQVYDVKELDSSYHPHPIESSHYFEDEYRSGPQGHSQAAILVECPVQLSKSGHYGSISRWHHPSGKVKNQRVGGLCMYLSSIRKSNLQAASLFIAKSIAS